MNIFLTEEAAGQAAETMNFDTILAVLLGITYVYIAFTAISHFIRLRKEGMLFESKLLYPTNCSMSGCIDEAGYVDFISPKMLLIGIVCGICAVYEGVSYFLWESIPLWLNIICTFVVPILLVVYMVVIYRLGAKRYW